jgi:hypothetical protein
MNARTIVRIRCRSHAEVKELASHLEEEGYRLVRLWRAVIAHAETPEEIGRLARCLRVDAGRHAGRVSDANPANPYSGWA